MFRRDTLTEDYDMTKEEFCSRFKAEMLRIAGADASDYAEQAAPTYWDNEDQRSNGPESCARSDISYWEG